MISVVIPLYNKSAYIEKCLRSVLFQTFRDFEIIVVDDGSTDDSLVLIHNILSNKDTFSLRAINDHSEERIKILSQKNSGVSTARNNGVKAAKYDYIAFLDADDWWAPNFLERMKVLIDSCPDAALYGCNYFYVKNKKKHVEPKGFSENFSLGYIDYIDTYRTSFVVPINCSFVIVKKNAFVEVDGFNPRLKLGEDFDLWIRLALRYRVAYNNQPLAYSNQDVSVPSRVLGQKKFWVPEEHFIFNLDYLQNEEKKNLRLNELLDGLRVRTLMRYYIAGWNKQEVKNILSFVDFDKQSAYFRRVYNCPRSIVKIWFWLMSIGSFVKQTLIRFF